jgi:YgiT-type zinc finger domain-containing protein
MLYVRCFGECPCGGTYETRRVEVHLRVEEQDVMLANLPQGACTSCGSLVYSGPVLRRLEYLMRSRPELVGEA